MDISVIAKDLLAKGYTAEDLCAEIQKADAARKEAEANVKKLNIARKDLIVAIINYLETLQPDCFFSEQEVKALEKIILDYEKQVPKMLNMLDKALDVSHKNISDTEVIYNYLKKKGLV